MAVPYLIGVMVLMCASMLPSGGVQTIFGETFTGDVRPSSSECLLRVSNRISVCHNSKQAGTMPYAGHVVRRPRRRRTLQLPDHRSRSAAVARLRRILGGDRAV